MEGHTGPCHPQTRSSECLGTPEGRQGCRRASGSPFQSPNAKQPTVSSPTCPCPSSSSQLDWLILLLLRSARANAVQDPDSELETVLRALWGAENMGLEGRSL